MNRFFTQTHCDRCCKPLTNGRIMSMYNNQCICMECKEKERQRADYKQATDADRHAIEQKNYNFAGIGLR